MFGEPITPLILAPMEVKCKSGSYFESYNEGCNTDVSYRYIFNTFLLQSYSYKEALLSIFKVPYT